MGIPHFLLAAWEFVARNIHSLGVGTARCNSLVGREDVLVILTAPAFIVDIKQRLLARCLNL
jgi:hypothetical protein